MSIITKVYTFLEVETDIKNLFAFIENCQVNIGRGGSQKAHVLSRSKVIFLFNGNV